MAFVKKSTSNSEVTIVLTVSLTDIIKVDDNEEKAQKQTEAEIKKIEKALNKIAGIDNVSIQATKVFPNIKEAETQS